MKKLIVALLVLLSGFSADAQVRNPDSDQQQTGKNENSIHKIIFQITTDDTLAQKSLMKQLNNILTISPGSKLEVVCHGPGINMLVGNRTLVQDKIAQLKNRGVEFVACEFTMSEKKLTKEDIIPEAGFVKGGIIEIVTRQEEGWSYIKSGF